MSQPVMSGTQEPVVPGGVVEPAATPDLPDVQQREILAPALLIHPDGPVWTHELPCENAAGFTEVPASTTMVKILAGPDRKRKRVNLYPDGAILVSFTGRDGSGCRVPANMPFSTSYVGSIWIALPSGTTPVNVGVTVEYGAE